MPSRVTSVTTAHRTPLLFHQTRAPPGRQRPLVAIHGSHQGIARVNPDRHPVRPSSASAASTRRVLNRRSADDYPPDTQLHGATNGLKVPHSAPYCTRRPVSAIWPRAAALDAPAPSSAPSRFTTCTHSAPARFHRIATPAGRHCTRFHAWGHPARAARRVRCADQSRDTPTTLPPCPHPFVGGLPSNKPARSFPALGVHYTHSARGR